MSIIGEPFKSYVDGQIRIRQELMGKLSDRGPEMIAWANSKTAWVKLASGIFLSGSFAEDRLNSIGLTPTTEYMGTQLAQKNVLFGGNSEREGQSDATFALQQRSTFDQVYNSSDTDFGLVPMPGIESIDVKNKNRGSIKEANIQIKAYSRRQLEIIDTLFLRLGYTVLLEWGNSHYIDNTGAYKKMGTTCAEKFSYFFANKEEKVHPNSHKDFLRAIERLRDDYDGNYDGFLAKVTNFSWTFEPDGTYKITLKLISLGDVIESLKINLSPTNPYGKTGGVNVIYQYLEQFKAANSIGGNGFQNKLTAAKQIGGNEVFGKEIGYFINGDSFPVPELEYTEDAGTPEDLQEDKKTFLETYPWVRGIIQGGYQDIEYEEGIETEYLLGALTNENITTTDPPKLLEDTTSDLKSQEESIIQRNNSLVSFLGTEILDVGGPYYWYDSYFRIKIIPGTFVLNDPALDKEVVYLKYSSEGDDGEETNSTTEDINYYISMGKFLGMIKSNLLPINSQTGDKIIDIKTSSTYCKHSPNQISLDPRICIVDAKMTYPDTNEFAIFKELKTFTTRLSSNPDELMGNVMNIYLNFSMIKEAQDSNIDEEGNLSLFPFIESICNKLNKALGGINNLEPIVDEQTNTLRIIDSSLLSNKINAPQTPFQIYGYNGKIGSESESTFVRNVNLATKISPEFASMVSIGATAGGYTKGMEATAFSKWNRGMIDRFQEEYLQPTPISGSKDPNEPLTNYNLFLTKGEDDTRLNQLGYTIIPTDNNNEETFSKLSLDSEVIDTNIEVVTEFYRYLRAKSYEDNPDEYASTANGFIPFSLNLTMDGLSGMKIYNKIEVDTKFLPFNYPQTLKFIVKRVSHKLSNGDWETTVETTVVPGAYNFSGGGGTP